MFLSQDPGTVVLVMKKKTASHSWAELSLGDDMDLVRSQIIRTKLVDMLSICIERSMEYGTTPPPDRRRKSKQATPPLLKDACILNRYSSIVLFSFPGCFQVRPPLSSPEVRLSPTIENQAVTSATQARSPRPPSEDNTGSSSPWPGTTQTTTLSLVMFSN